MASKYNFIVSACKKYVPEICALLNSLDFIGNKEDVFVIGYQLPKEFTEQFSKLSYTVHLYDIPEEEARQYGGEGEILCRKRYWYAAQWGKDYEAICVLDADMIFARNPWQFFDIAHKTGFILGVSKEQNKLYDHDHCMTHGKWEWKNVPRGFWNDKDVCNCPLFLDAKIWGDALKRSWEVFSSEGFKAPDMDALNLCLLEVGAHDKIVKLPGLQWLGTNEQNLKPYIRVGEKQDGKLWTENGLEIFSYHGQYYKALWRQTQLENRHRCAAGYLGTTEKPDAMAAGALELLHKTFLKMLDYKIQIEKKAYVEKGEPQ